MSLANISVNVYAGESERAQAAAEGLRDLIGDRDERWEVSIFSATNLRGELWIVGVTGRWHGTWLSWHLPFQGPENATSEAVVRQFRHNLEPYSRDDAKSSSVLLDDPNPAQPRAQV